MTMLDLWLKFNPGCMAGYETQIVGFILLVSALAMVASGLLRRPE